MTSNHEQNINMVTSIILTMMDNPYIPEAYDLDHWREVNSDTGFDFDIRYSLEAERYTNDNSFTRVNGLKLSKTDLEAAFDAAKQATNSV